VNDAAMAREYGETRVAAEALGIALQPLGVHTANDLGGAYQAAVDGRLDGAIVLADPMIARSRERLVELATTAGVPTMSGDATFAAAGGLMAYGPNLTRQVQRVAYYVDRILRGANPADLPVEQPMLFDFVVSMKTARELGITFPNDIMLQVNEVIQ
jgi:putative tryptophan/tyrosine transport system substrate-binding protein